MKLLNNFKNLTKIDINQYKNDVLIISLITDCYELN